jgi:hypothetical protein
MFAAARTHPKLTGALGVPELFLHGLGLITDMIE